MQSKLMVMPIAVTVMLMVACFGCRTRPLGAPRWQAAPFLSDEILSRRWTNAEGRMMQVLESSTMTSKHLGEFLIVRVGDKDLNEAYYCEFYLIKRVPSRPYTDTSQQNLPVKIMPEHTVNYLLARGLSVGAGIIGAIDMMRDDKDRVIFSCEVKAKHQYAIRFSQEPGEEPKKIRVRWHGGTLWQLKLSKNYEPQWWSRLYGDTTDEPTNALKVP